MNKYLLAITLLFFAPENLAADTIYLKSGRILKGNLAKVADKRVYFYINNKKAVIIPQKAIRRIERQAEQGRENEKSPSAWRQLIENARNLGSKGHYLRAVEQYFIRTKTER